MGGTAAMISLLGGIAIFSLVVLVGLVDGSSPVPLLCRACGAGGFGFLLVLTTASIVRSVVQECLEVQESNENNVEEKGNS